MDLHIYIFSYDFIVKPTEADGHCLTSYMIVVVRVWRGLTSPRLQCLYRNQVPAVGKEILSCLAS